MKKNCDLCEYGTDNMDLYHAHCNTQRHNRIKNGEIEYRCPYRSDVDHYNDGTFRCGYRTFEKRLYDNHTKETLRHKGDEKVVEYEKGEEKQQLKVHKCEQCKYETIRLDNYKRHIQTYVHKRNIIEKRIVIEVEYKYKYTCERCNYKTNDKSHFSEHLETIKHKNKETK